MNRRISRLGGVVLVGGLVLIHLAGRWGWLGLDPLTNRLDQAYRPPRAAWLACWIAPGAVEETATSGAPADPAPEEFDLLASESLAVRPTTGDLSFLLGTDGNGRDLLSRLILGFDPYLLPALLSVTISLAGGVLLGAAGAYAGGRTDRSIQLLLEVISSFPRLMLILLAAAIFRPQIWLILSLLGVLNIPRVARRLRERVLVCRRSEWVEAARALGCSPARLLLDHILWRNCREILATLAAVGWADCVLTETGLCYLGFGVQEPHASWGNMVIAGGEVFFAGLPYVSLLPALAIMLCLLGFHLLARGLSALD